MSRYSLVHLSDDALLRDLAAIVAKSEIERMLAAVEARATARPASVGYAAGGSTVPRDGGAP